MKPEEFPSIDATRARAIVNRLNAEAFHLWLGLSFEEIRLGYARLRLAHRAELEQAGGIIHGGAIASALDTVVLGAILSMFEERPHRAATIDLHVHFIESVSGEDVIAEARLRRLGKSITFAEAEARTEGGRVLAHAEASWALKS
jgi:uncharacterized protein (TIGR00369 family)